MTDLPNPAPEFDPTPYLTDRGENRKVISLTGLLRWLRHEHPGALVNTEQIGHSPDDWATFKATVEVPGIAGEGGMVSTGHGMAYREEIGTLYYTAAERSALHEAITGLDIGADYRVRIMDVPAPVATSPELPQNQRNEANRYQDTPPAHSAQQRPAPHGYGASQNSGTPRPGPGPITEPQINLIWRLAKDLEYDSGYVHTLIRDAYQTETVDQLTKANASKFIDWLNEQKRGGAQ